MTMIIIEREFYQNEIRQLRQFSIQDLERAFNAGGANAAKLRVSGNKLTLPVLEFSEWFLKFQKEKK